MGIPEMAVAARRRKLIGLAVLAVPLALFVVFGIAEAAGGEAGWWGHLIQLGVAALLAAVAWFRPTVGGWLLVVSGAALAGWALVESGREDVYLFVLFVLPLVVAGLFFVRAGRTGG